MRMSSFIFNASRVTTVSFVVVYEVRVSPCGGQVQSSAMDCPSKPTTTLRFEGCICVCDFGAVDVDDRFPDDFEAHTVYVGHKWNVVDIIVANGMISILKALRQMPS